MNIYNKNINPSELGPWIQGISYKEPDQIQEEKNINDGNNTEHTNLHQRTSLKLPDILRTNRNSLSIKKSKHLLKVSHQSLDIEKNILKQTNIKSRYGALNGSLLHTFKPKGIRQSSKSPHFVSINSETLDSNSLDRKVSMVQIGEPINNHRVSRAKRRKLMNQQCAKKRSLMHFIRQVTLNNQFMNFYLLNKREKGYKLNDI